MFRILTGMAAAAIAFITLGVTQPAMAQQGQCPAFTAAVIDNAYTDWVIASGFDAVVGPIMCDDDPTVPQISLIASNPVTTSLFNAVTTEDGPNFWVASGVTQVGDTFVVYGVAENLTVPERHICRGEILRSFTWRQLCQLKVDRSAN